MTQKEIANIFEKMRLLVILTEAQRAYTAPQWRDLVGLWHSIFASEYYTHVWAGIRRYIHDGGKFWPYPGEIIASMPAGDPDADALRDLKYETRAQAKARRERDENRRVLGPSYYEMR